MGRPLPRLLSPLLVLLLLPLAAGQLLAEDPDPTGDVTSKPGVEADEPSVDLVRFTAERDGDTLVLRNEVAGALPLAGAAEANETRLYTFLFAVDLESKRDRPLVQSADVVIVCTFHHGVADLSCEQSQGERTLTGIGVHDRNVTVRLALQSGEALEPVVGGGAVTLQDEPDESIIAQDWTPSTIGGQDPGQPDGGGERTDGDEEIPWTRRPVTGLAMAFAVVGLSVSAYRRFKGRQ